MIVQLCNYATAQLRVPCSCGLLALPACTCIWTIAYVHGLPYTVYYVWVWHKLCDLCMSRFLCCASRLPVSVTTQSISTRLVSADAYRLICLVSCLDPNTAPHA
ncbi:hypothetical protein LZ30DRAFT_714531 [Colletotrichum cereale]|nr:hypothetical protein LZ30DRAFT_714531 [Colletotrichum cereale]